MIKPLAKRLAVDSGTVCVPIGMYSQQLVYKVEVHMGRFVFVKALSVGVWASLHAWFTGTVVAKFRPVSYDDF